MHLRADDGIRTRDPHLGKVMRYQLRYVRAQRTRSSPGAKHDDSPRDPAHTNPLVPCVSRLTLAHVTACGAFCGPLFVLVFDVVRPLGAGPVAQWKSVRFTRGRSLVRSQPGPPASAQLVGSDASLDTTRGPAFGPFMRPICGQVADWPHGGRSLATSRRRTFLRRLFKRAPVQATTALGCAPTTSQQPRTRSCGRCPTLAKSRFRRCRSLTRRARVVVGETFLR